METSEHKWVNPNGIQYGVNSLKLRGFQISVSSLISYYIDYLIKTSTNLTNVTNRSTDSLSKKNIVWGFS